MKKKSLYNFFEKAIQKIDWKLLLFLLLFLNVKLVIKVLAIVIIYLLRFNFRFGFKQTQSRLPWFYIILIAIGFLNLLLYGLYSNLHYDLTFLTGISFWLLCILAIHQIKLSIENNETQIIHNTLIAFFFINAIVSLGNLLQIIIETGAINPYTYQGMYQKYFIGTGDKIRGISFDTSTTNAILNAFGIIYFLRRRETLLTILCMIVLLLTGSNLTNILISVSLIYLFIFKSTREQKSIISIFFFLFIIFMAKISPQNHEYAEKLLTKTITKKETKVETIQTAALIATPESNKKKQAKDNLDSEYAVLQQKGKLIIASNNVMFKPSIPKPNINAPEYQNRNDTTQLQRDLKIFVKQHHLDSSVFKVKEDWYKTPGKLTAMRQTAMFLKEHPSKIFFGNGMGNFSSKLAFRVTALTIAGSYPSTYQYLNNDFLKNHLAVFLYYFTRQKELHSVANTPDSTYDQLAGEYGLAGLTALLIFYVGFFIKRIKNIAEAIPFLLIMLSAFAMGYWFEQLSVVPVFELMMFLNTKNKIS